MSNITVVGCGYVGVSLAVMLSKKNKVIAFDIDSKKVKKINERISPIKDEDIEKAFNLEKLNLKATTNKEIAFNRPDFIIIATPTDYDPDTNFFDTSIVEKVAEEAMSFSPNTTIIIKSTIPIGFTRKLRKKLNSKNIIFSPEFLREGSALYDNLNPSRIILGDTTKKAKDFSNLLVDCVEANKERLKVYFFEPDEAEAIKLFSNTYLAARISFFNEMDNFCISRSLNTLNVINGVCSDSRIGFGYNNPSFGYGGYCLPKDTKQLSANFKDIPNDLISSTIKSNSSRKDFITQLILDKRPRTVGVFRLAMKSGSDNFRSSSIIDIAERLRKLNINIIVYEPLIKEEKWRQLTVNNRLNDFKQQADVIIANRLSDDLVDVMDKVFSRDLFRHDK